MVDPLVSFLGVESGNMIGHKRFLALFAGGMLPLISLSFLHMLVKFEEEEKNAKEVIDIDEISKIAGTIEKKTIEEEKYTPTEEDIKKIEEILLKKENHIITDENVGKTTKNTLIVEKKITNDINDSDSTIVGNIEEDVVQTVEEPKIKRLFYSKRDG
jgi:predicted RND superfamily exporter protein